MKLNKCILVDYIKLYERGIYSKNLDMQKRFINQVSSSFNMIQLTIGWIHLPNRPESGLI